MDKVSDSNMMKSKLSDEVIIEVKNVKKIYRMGSERISAVNDVSFDIKKGEFCCLLGTSGSGKSTLLNLMAGIEKASGGQIKIKGKNIRTMSEKQLAKFRQRYLGFVFQSYNLLNSMTALENVEFPLVFKRIPGKKRKRMAKEMLTKVGLGPRINHRPKQMSGGQQQRVGIARAFVAKPEIVFADEPTGNLDTRTTMEVMNLIKQIARDNQQTIVMVTHDPRLAAFADKIIHILDGNIQSVELIENPANTIGMPEESNEKPKEAAETETEAAKKGKSVKDADEAIETIAETAAARADSPAKMTQVMAAETKTEKGAAKTAEGKAKEGAAAAAKTEEGAAKTAKADSIKARLIREENSEQVTGK